jgi:hypothetical protein
MSIRLGLWAPWKLAILLLSFSGCVPAGAQDLESLTKLKEGTNFRTSSTNADWKASNVDFVPILPGKTLTLADVKGPGTIRRIWMTILPSEPGYSRLMTLRIYWDGEPTPSVQCPVGDFFAVGHGVDTSVDSIPVHVSAEGRARSCYWVMPFHKSARITVSNDGSLATWCFYYQVDGRHEPVQRDAPYFHAQYRQEFPCTSGDYVIADIRGKGQYVGSVVSVRSTSEGWFGEGNDYFYVDGEAVPSLKGTGFEDYFGEAWALRVTNGPYSGCPLFEGGYTGARATCYRWHIPDPISFQRSLKVTIQHQGVGQDLKGEWHNNIERPDEYSSVGFWYQQGPGEPVENLPIGPERLPFDYRNFIEAENLKSEPPDSGKVEVVKANGLHGDADLEWTRADVGSELSLPFSVPKKGRYQLMILTAKSSDGGTGEWLIDGKPMSGKVSFYLPDYMMHQEKTLEISELDAGKHKLTLRCLGAPSEADEGRRFAIDGFIVQPMRPGE